MTDEVERVARAMCREAGADPDSSAALVTWRYDDANPHGLMVVGRYEEGWHYKDPSKVPRNPSGRKAWTWFTDAAAAAIAVLPTTFTGPWVKEVAEDGTVTVTDVGETDIGNKHVYSAEDVKRLFGGGE